MDPTLWILYDMLWKKRNLLLRRRLRISSSAKSSSCSRNNIITIKPYNHYHHHINHINKKITTIKFVVRVYAANIDCTYSRFLLMVQRISKPLIQRSPKHAYYSFVGCYLTYCSYSGSFYSIYFIIT